MKTLLLTLLLLISCCQSTGVSDYEFTLHESIDIHFLFPIGISQPQRYKDVVSASTKDPDSVRWRGLRFFTPSKNGRKVTVLCGQFNAKNSLGGYVGYSHFVSNGVSYSSPSKESSQPERNAVRSAIRCLCRNGEIPSVCKR